MPASHSGSCGAERGKRNTRTWCAERGVRVSAHGCGAPRQLAACARTRVSSLAPSRNVLAASAAARRRDASLSAQRQWNDAHAHACVALAVVTCGHALLLSIDATMHGEHRRTFHSGMPALGVRAKQRLHRQFVLRQPAQRQGLFLASACFARQAHTSAVWRAAAAAEAPYAQYCSTKRR
jgi:predicted component of type VI protein secretion system